jgi:hypothetical protein
MRRAEEKIWSTCLKTFVLSLTFIPTRYPPYNAPARQ